MKKRFSIALACCPVVLIVLAFLFSTPAFHSTARAFAPNKATPTISKNVNAGRVGNLQVALTPAANRLLPLNANSQLPANVIPDSFWKKGGNAGTNPSTNFIGTTDNVAFEVRVNNQRALRIEPNASSPNFIEGFSGNFVTTGVVGATVGGGGGNNIPNRINDNFGTVGGGRGNRAGDDAGTTIDHSYATVGGGDSNAALGRGSSIAGGVLNITRGENSFVGGGNDNAAEGFDDAIGGGFDNIASGGHDFIGGGQSNYAESQFDVIGGGFHNIATGNRATVPGGDSNQAGGDYSFAAGRRAILDAAADGSFMFADSNDFDFNSNATNAFRARVTGGAKFVLGIDGSGNPTWSCSVTNGNSWSCSSDRNLKENFQAVNAREVLEKVVTLSVVKWNAKGQNVKIKHLGPMAQDFYAAFGLGDDDKSISTIDLDGVALVSIQALYEMWSAQQSKLDAQQREINSLHQQLDALEARLKKLETAQAK